MGVDGGMQAGREALILAAAVGGGLCAAASCFAGKRAPWLVLFLGGVCLVSAIPLLLGSAFLGVASLLVFSGMAPLVLIADRINAPATGALIRGRRLAGAVALSLGTLLLLFFAIFAVPWSVQGGGSVAAGGALQQLGDTIAAAWALPYEAAALFIPAAAAASALLLARRRRR